MSLAMAVRVSLIICRTSSSLSGPLLSLSLIVLYQCQIVESDERVFTDMNQREFYNITVLELAYKANPK